MGEKIGRDYFCHFPKGSYHVERPVLHPTRGREACGNKSKLYCTIRQHIPLWSALCDECNVSKKKGWVIKTDSEIDKYSSHEEIKKWHS